MIKKVNQMFANVFGYDIFLYFLFQDLVCVLVYFNHSIDFTIDIIIKEIDGWTVEDYFREKFDDEATFMSIARAIGGKNQTILL